MGERTAADTRTHSATHTPRLTHTHSTHTYRRVQGMAGEAEGGLAGDVELLRLGQLDHGPQPAQLHRLEPALFLAVAVRLRRRRRRRRRVGTSGRRRLG